MSNNLVLYYLYGEGPLWRVFWLWGVVGSWILFAIFIFALQAIGVTWALVVVSAVVMMPYSVWILASVWQCAPHVGNDFWGNLARFLTVIWALNLGVVGGFLIRDLIVA
jgi:hypothetical protein